MSSRSETGHAKNVANLSALIIILHGFDGKYNPSNELIALPALSSIEKSCIAALNGLKVEHPLMSRAISDREIAMQPINKLAQRIVNFLRSTSAPQKTIDAAKTLSDKINGRKKPQAKPVEPVAKPAEPVAEGTEPVVKAETEAKPTRVISTLQTSIDSRIDNFDKLVKLVNSTPEYVPNEDELKVERLQEMYGAMQAANSKVIETAQKLNNLRVVRDRLLYDEQNGLIALVNLVKAYLRAVFELQSSEYKQVTALKFSTPRK